MKTASWSLVTAIMLIGCGDDGVQQSPREVVRDRIDALAPAANIGHRGTGATAVGNAFPENSLAAFADAIAQGADGIELDVELTSDGQLIVMHDDTLDRTTDCTGCVNSMTFDEVRNCRLLDGDGTPTAEPPPTLEESYNSVPGDALVNVELKVFGQGCFSMTTDAIALALAAIDEIDRLGVANTTLVSSFDETAAATVVAESELYSAQLLVVADAMNIAEIDAAGQDAVHVLSIADEVVADALGRGLHVNVWTVNDEESMRSNIARGVTAIITDVPATLVSVLASL